MHRSDDDILKGFGQRLMDIMAYEGFDNEGAFAKRLGIHPNTLTRYKRGEGSPDLRFITFLCDQFNVSIGWLLGGDTTQTIDENRAARGLAPDGSTIPGQTPLPPYISPPDEEEPDDRPDEMLINVALLKRLARIVVTSHRDARIKLAAEEVSVLAADLYNDMMDRLADPTDPQEIETALPQVEYLLRKRLAKTVSAPGTGKREAS